MNPIIERFFLAAPTALICALLFVLLAAAMQVAILIRRRQARTAAGKEADAGQPAGHEGYVLSAALGLLALLLGFTFSLAVDRHDRRNSLVVEEANAIGTAYLRVQLLEEPHRSALSLRLERYVEHRLVLATSTSVRQRRELLRESGDMQAELWNTTVAAVRPIVGSVFAVAMVEAMNTMFDAGASRVATRRAHVPVRVMLMLALCMIIATFTLGYVMGPAGRRVALLVLLGLFTLNYGLILELDRPTTGGIREPQAPMEDLLEFIRSMPPGSAPGRIAADGRYAGKP